MPTLVYSTEATAHGARQGRAVSTDQRLDVNLSVPRAMGGDDGPGTNPEQLFAAGYASCFHGALKAVSRMKKVSIDNAKVAVKVDFLKEDEGSFKLAAHITANIPGVEKAVAEDLLAAAHKMCPYSRATRGNIDVDVKLA